MKATSFGGVVAKNYLEHIKNPTIILSVVLNGEGHVWHPFVIRYKERDNFQNYMTQNGVQTLIHYPIPPHKQEAFKEYNPLSFPFTEQVHNEVLSLPISGAMTKQEVRSVVDVINNFKL